MSTKFNIGVAAVLIASAVGVSAAVLHALNSVEITDFEDYKPPSRLDVITYDYMDEHGSPSATPTEYPTWQADFPYRAFLLGARPTSNNGTQDHDCVIYVVYSKTPTLDFFSFTYMPGTKTSNQTGYIRADYADGWDTMGRDKDWLIMSWSRTGVTAGSETVPLYSQSTYPSVVGRKYFDFDFYYQCCGTLSINGLRNITDVPYPYILTCTDLSGNGGGSQAGSSSTGSGGDSSGGSSSGGGSSGGSSSRIEVSIVDDDIPDDWEFSVPADGESSDSSYPWEDDSNTPDLDGNISSPPYVNNGEDGEGENGDTWSLPEWNLPDGLPFGTGDLNVPDFPVDIQEGYPDFPGNMQEGYPDLVFPSGAWPPDMPTPAP